MGHTILLADDSITIQKVIELTFSDEDFKLHTVGNGQKAIDEIHTVRPDIVLCDIIMPEKNGYEVCEYIKSNPDLKHTPVLLLTGAFEPFDQERARNAGCDGFLAKPFEPQTLISKVKELLSAAQRAPSAPPPAPAKPEAGTPAAPPPSFLEPEAGAEEPPTVELSQMSQPVFDEPTAVPPELTDEGATVMADHFAVEAGERELSVEPGDQTVLLGGEETEGPVGEDIWSEVQQYSEPSIPSGGESQDESATVFMSPPSEEETEEPPIGEPEVSPFGSPEEPSEPSYGSGADAWVLEEEPGAQAGEPELTPLGEFGGFEDFSAAEQAAPPEPEVYATDTEIFAAEASSESIGKKMPISTLPLKSPSEAGPRIEDKPPFVEAAPVPAPPERKPSAEHAAPAAPPQARPVAPPRPPVSPERKPVVESPPPPAPPRAKPFSEPPSPPAPPKAKPMAESAPPAVPPKAKPVVEPPAPPAPPPKAKPAVQPMSEFTPAAQPSPWTAEPTFEPLEQEPAEEEPAAPFEPEAVIEPEEPIPAQPSFDETPIHEMSAEAPSLSPQDVDALVDRIAERVIAKLSEQAIKEVAWEVVPDLAQTLIQREIDALKAKIPK